MTNSYVIPMSWRNLLLVLAGGVALWALPWLPWAGTGPVPAHEARRKLPVYRYIRSERTIEGSTWSPVLMPFPTSVGFSRKAALTELPAKSSTSVLKPKVLTPLYLDLKTPALPPVGAPAMAPLAGSGFNPESAANPVFESTGVTRTNGGLQVEIPDELRARQFSAPRLETVLLPAGDQAGFAMAVYVELDPRGFVQHLLLEQPSGVAGVDAQVLRRLKAGTGVPGTGLASGRIKLYYWKTDRMEKE